MTRPTALLLLATALGCRAATPTPTASVAPQAPQQPAPEQADERDEPALQPEPDEPMPEPAGEPDEPAALAVADPEPASADPAPADAAPRDAPTTGAREERGDGRIGLGNTCKITACSPKRRWRTKIRLTKVTVDDSLSRDLVSRLLHSHEWALHSCYQDALDEERRLAGTIELHLVIAPEPGKYGAQVRVAEGTGASTPALSEVERCFLRVARRLHFPRPRGQPETEVTVRLTLTPDGRGPPTIRK
ncbi:MAG: AgmX/PglI C-terminal domain-containing protein [Myxococcales bacterium]|nr:AgmX/PglI C-terminal domain-containing protein [Myxococcales bacterium]